MKANLTDRYLRNLKPPETGRLEISDTKRRGLRIRVSPKGSFVWMFEKRVKGGPKRKHTLGNWPALSLADAREAALEIEAEARRGIDRVAIENERRLEEETASAMVWCFFRKDVQCPLINYSQLQALPSDKVKSCRNTWMVLRQLPQVTTFSRFAMTTSEICWTKPTLFCSITTRLNCYSLRREPVQTSSHQCHFSRLALNLLTRTT